MAENNALLFRGQDIKASSGQKHYIALKILLSIGSWNPAHGGPFFSVGNLAKALAREGHEVHLLAAGYPHMPPHEPPAGVTLHLLEGRLIPGIRQTVLSQAAQKIDALLESTRPDVIHDNGLWLSLNHHVALAARRHGIPHVVSPRGTLDPWAMQYRNWKKRIALRLFQQKDLESVTAFHAASELEARNIRAFGLKQPVMVIPNGVDIPDQPAHFGLGDGRLEIGDGRLDMEDGRSEIDSSNSGNVADSTSHLPSSNSHLLNTRTALFMGRFHPVKNLPTLLEAWAKVRPAGWTLRLVGADEVNHKALLAAKAREWGIADTVEILEPMYGAAKEQCLREAQLFFLVSKSENFGISAAEAMAVGLPVITSKEIPWSCVESERLGWWVPGQVDPLAEAIQAATQLEPKALAAIGARGRDYARKAFGWDRIAKDFIQTYSWIQGDGQKPEFVV